MHHHLNAQQARGADQSTVCPACCPAVCCLQLQSVQLPFALIPVLAFNASETLMGKFVNSKGMIACTVAISLVVMFVNVSGVLAFFEAALSGASLYVWGSVAVAVVLYLLFVGYLFLHATAAAGLLPPILGFVAQQPGGVSTDSVGGGVFVALPFDPDSSEGEGDEETGQDLIRALPSPSTRAAMAADAMSAAEPLGSSDDEEQQQQRLHSSSAAGDSSGSIGGGAWLSDSPGAGSGAPAGAGVLGDEEQQLVQPLLRGAADHSSQQR